MVSERRKLVERLFQKLEGNALGDWIADQRDPATGEGRQSWRAISKRLYDEHDIELTDVTLINWFGGRERETAA